MSKSSINTKSSFFLSGNPWSCNCQNIKHIQEFVQKYSSLIKDAEKIYCDNWDNILLHIDYKDRCYKSQDPMIWVIIVEVILLVLLIGNFVWDVVRYRRSGHLPWIARNLCGSVQGRTRPSWWGRIYKQCRQENCIKKEETNTVNEYRRCDEADFNINEVQGHTAVKFNI
jgi:hypothetical protein